MDFIRPPIIDTKLLYKSSLNVSDEPLFKINKFMLILLKNNKSKEIYDQFLTDLSNYSLKAADNTPKQIYHTLSSRDLIYLGKPISSNTAIPGLALITPKDELGGIILDIESLDLDLKTGITSNCDLAFYSLYFEYIRAAIICHQSEIVKDEKLDNYLLGLLYMMFLKILGISFTLNEKQKTILMYCIGYFYYRFMKNFYHDVAISKSLDLHEEYRDEVKFILKTFDKYSRMKDVFKGLVDFKIITESPAVLIMKTIKRFGIFTFYCLTTSLDYLTAMFIVSLYSTSLFESLRMSNTLQKELESYLYSNYMKKVKFNTSFITPQKR